MPTTPDIDTWDSLEAECRRATMQIRKGCYMAKLRLNLVNPLQCSLVEYMENPDGKVSGRIGDLT